MKYLSVVLLLVAATSAHAADDFVEACMLGSGSGNDMAKTCACMSSKVPADIRADAAEALRRANRAITDTSRPIDPSTLPPNLMKGLQATVLAQADCM
jgi:hypothetical protein